MMKMVCNTVLTLLLTSIVFIGGALILPKIFGYEIFAVQSGSMEPKYNVGSVVYVKPSKPEDVQVGDPITFYRNGIKNIVATHRVVSINTQDKLFTTKGDANDVEDLEPQKFDSLIGKVVFSIPMLGYITMYIKTTEGMIAAITIFIVVALLSIIIDLLGKKQNGVKK